MRTLNSFAHYKHFLARYRFILGSGLVSAIIIMSLLTFSERQLLAYNNITLYSFLDFMVSPESQLNGNLNGTAMVMLSIPIIVIFYYFFEHIHHLPIIINAIKRDRYFIYLQKNIFILTFFISGLLVFFSVILSLIASNGVGANWEQKGSYFQVVLVGLGNSSVSVIYYQQAVMVLLIWLVHFCYIAVIGELTLLLYYTCSHLAIILALLFSFILVDFFTNTGIYFLINSAIFSTAIAVTTHSIWLRIAYLIGCAILLSIVGYIIFEKKDFLGGNVDRLK